MAAPSDDFESADYDALRTCSLQARGLWADMRVLMKNSRRRGYLHKEGKPISLRQLALATGCNTDEARPLVEELLAAGVCAHSPREGYYSPRIVAYESFRKKCSKAGQKGGGNPALQKEPGKAPPFKGRSKGWSKGSSAAPPPDGSPSPTPPIPSLSLPPGVVKAACPDPAEARQQAAAWIQGNRPADLKPGTIAAMAALIQRIGREAAAAEVSTWLARPDVQNPYAYALSLYDEHGRPKGPARPPAVVNGNGRAAGNGHHPARPRSAVAVREDN